MAALFFPALAIVACPAFSKPVWSAGPPAPAEAAAGLEEARTLVGTGRFEEALAILRPLVRARAAPAGVLFNIGLAAIGASQRPGVSEGRREALLREAISALRRMLVDRPDLARVRLELARAFFLKGEDSLARRHFERVLAGKPPAPVALSVSRFLAQIRARKRWTVHVGAAIAPDSNISSRSDEDRILIDTPFGRAPFAWRGDKPQSGIGIALSAGGEYQFPLNPRSRLRAGAEFSRREYRSDEFDRMFLGAHLGPRWLIGRASEVSVLASVRQSWLADEDDFRDLGGRIEARRRLSRRTVAFVDAAWHQRRYEGRDWLNGPVADVSGGIDWVATPTIRVNAAIGWGRQRTKRKRQRHRRRWLRLGASVLLPWGFTVGGAAALRWTEYRGNWAPFVIGGGSRSDATRTLRVDVHNRAFTLGGFSPQISAVQEVRTSNAQLHGYVRVSGELRFVRQF